MDFNPSIDLGTIIAAASVILTIWGFHTRNRDNWTEVKEDMAVIRSRVTTLWKRSGIDDGSE